MKLDVATLGTFYRMAREGAGLAAGRLSHMTGVDTRVGLTKLNFLRGDEIRRELASPDTVAIRFDISGEIDGESLLVFDTAGIRQIVDPLMPDPDEDTVDPDEELDRMTQSAIAEVGQVMNNGLVDGWADVLESVIDVSPPTVAVDESADELLAGISDEPSDDELALLFQSQIETVGTELEFDHYLFPEHDSMADLLDRLRTSDGIPVDKLDGFDRMADRGADEMARAATSLTGIETTIDVRRLHFLSLEVLPEQVPAEPLVGVAFEFEGVPSGYLLFLFEEDSALEIVEAMMPPNVEADGFDEMGTSAITELGNIMASGFLDGWANVLDTTIDHSTPEFVHDIGPAAIDPIVVSLGEHQQYAFVFDTQVVAEGAEFDCEVYAITNEADLERALTDLNIDRVAEEPTTADFQKLDNT